MTKLLTNEFVLSEEQIVTLSGEYGENRALSNCKINANNDYQAIYCWLDEYKDKLTTFRTYQKEAERLLLWCIYEKHKPLSSLNRDDFNQYFNFLLSPKSNWCGYRSAKRGEYGWRPFVGPLSNSAYKSAITIIKSLLNYLVSARYLDYNPISLMRRLKIENDNKTEGKLNLHARILSQIEWDTMCKVLLNYPENTSRLKDKKLRLKLIVFMLYFLGLRVGELTSHTWQNFKNINSRWWFIVKGKGDKVGMIPVNDQLLAFLIEYRKHLGLIFEENMAATAIVASWQTGKPLTTRYINKLLKELAITTAQKFKKNDIQYNKLQKFSAHWLRHLSASHQATVGIDFNFIKANHRHEKDDTTQKYIHNMDDKRHEAMQKHKIEFFL